LARVQARDDVRDVLTWLDTVTKLGPQAAQIVDLAGTARWLAAQLGVPDELVRQQDPLASLAGTVAQAGASHGGA
jgi:hypothetical protein